MKIRYTLTGIIIGILFTLTAVFLIQNTGKPGIEGQINRKPEEVKTEVLEKLQGYWSWTADEYNSQAAQTDAYGIDVIFFNGETYGGFWYPGEYANDGKIEQIVKNEYGKYEVTVYYPAVYEYDTWFEEHTSKLVISSKDDFERYVTVTNYGDDGSENTFEYMRTGEDEESAFRYVEKLTGFGR